MIQIGFVAAMALLLLFALCDFNFPQALGWLVILLWLAGSFGFGTFLLTFR